MTRPTRLLFLVCLSALCLLCVLCAFVVSSSAADWPQWRGPERTGVCKETGLLKSWPKEGPPHVWTGKDLGGGYGTVSVAGGRIFGMGRRGDLEIVWALDEKDGKELWSTSLPRSTGKVTRNDGPRCTPTVAGDKVYALGIHGDLVCLDAAKGEMVWHKNLPKHLNGRLMSTWGYSESPLVDGDRLICTPGGDTAALAALNKNTGALIWKTHLSSCGGAGYSSIVVAEVGGVRQYVQLLGSALVGVAAEDGKLLWRYDNIANKTANIMTPIVRGKYVFCSTAYGTGAVLLELQKKDTKIAANEVYFQPGKKLQNHHGGMVLVGDHVYGGHGHNNGAPICVELLTGKIVWLKEPGPGEGSAAVLSADGCLYFRYQDGTIALIEATPDGYKLKSKFTLPGNNDKPGWAHPVIANGKLYLRDQEVLWCYDVKER